jgi:hypothetical protein
MSRFRKIPERLLIFIGFYVFFLCTLAANFSAPHDSIAYLNGIAGGYGLFHPHHLIYHWTTHYWLVFIRGLFPGIKDYYLVEAYTALWGSGIMVMVWSFFRNRFTLSVLVSGLGTSVIAFSYGIWFYSINIEVYAPPMFLLLVALYLLTKNDFTKSDVWKVALLHSLAVLFHQINILFTVVVLYKLWQQRKLINGWSALLQYVGIGAVLVGGAYFIIGWMVEGQNSMAKWIGWMQGYAHSETYWRSLSIKTPLNVATGFSHAMIGGHYIFRVPVIGGYINAIASEHSLTDEIYLGRHISETTAIVLTILSVVLAVIVLLLAIRFIRHFNSIRIRYGNIVVPLLITGIAYSLFFCFWETEILEFWLLQVVLFWLLLIGTLPVSGFPLRIKNAAGLAIISVLLFVINFFGSIRWLLDVRNDWYYTLIEPVKERSTAKDIILLQDAWILKDFATYYTKAHVLWVVDHEKPALDSAVTGCLANGGKVYIYSEHRRLPLVSDTKYIDSLVTANKEHETILSKEKPAIIVIAN